MTSICFLQWQIDRSLKHRINYKFMCLSAYWQWNLANERTRISAVIVKIIIEAPTEFDAMNYRLWSTRIWVLQRPFNDNSKSKQSHMCTTSEIEMLESRVGFPKQWNSGHVNVPKFCSNKFAWLWLHKWKRCVVSTSVQWNLCPIAQG